jgi:hypothetical protein
MDSDVGRPFLFLVNAALSRISYRRRRLLSSEASEGRPERPTDGDEPGFVDAVIAAAA